MPATYIAEVKRNTSNVLKVTATTGATAFISRRFGYEYDYHTLPFEVRIKGYTGEYFTWKKVRNIAEGYAVIRATDLR